MSSNQPATQIAVIDTSVEGHEVLAADATQQGMEVLLLSGEGNRFEELATRLEGREDIDALHLLSHGSEGSIHLGNDRLSV